MGGEGGEGWDCLGCGNEQGTAGGGSAGAVASEGESRLGFAARRDEANSDHDPTRRLAAPRTARHEPAREPTHSRHTNATPPTPTPRHLATPPTLDTTRRRNGETM